MYIKPAVRKSRKLARQDRSNLGKPPKEKGKAKGGLPSKEQYIQTGKLLGLSEEHLGAEYDKWAAGQVTNGSAASGPGETDRGP